MYTRMMNRPEKYVVRVEDRVPPKQVAAACHLPPSLPTSHISYNIHTNIYVHCTLPRSVNCVYLHTHVPMNAGKDNVYVPPGREPVYLYDTGSHSDQNLVAERLVCGATNHVFTGREMPQRNEKSWNLSKNT